jgi:GNAT superfamily N-acetyltransferase
MSADFVIVQEHPSLLKYVDDLQRKNSDALSFYPMQVFEREAQKGRLFLGLLNGQPCGYIYMGAPAVDVKCHQVCIQYDARRRLYGASLVVAAEDYAQRFNASTITLRCGFELDANDFWQSLGYGVVAKQPGGIRRMRTINVWRKELQPSLFQQLFIEPARGKIDASLWAKHKQTGIVTQFARGRAMSDYRARIIANSETDDGEAA